MPLTPEQRIKRRGWSATWRKFKDRQPCSECGKPGMVHHKDRDPNNNAAGNVEWLCRGCHSRRHIEEGEIGRDPLTGRLTKAGVGGKRTQCFRGHDLSQYGFQASYQRKGKEKRFYTGCRECLRIQAVARKER